LGQISINKTKAVKKIGLISISLNKTIVIDISLEVVLPYLGLHNVQDFAQILYFVGVVRIINRNNVFHSFPDREITCPPCFFVYYCQHAKLNIS
jgi:hypothetical protein